MTKNHLKSLAAPRTWPTFRKKNTFITRPNPGGHSMLFGMPLATVMTELIKCAKTKKEVKSIIKNKNILVDGKKRGDDKFMVGLMDTISIKETDEHYRMLLNRKGKITVIKVDEKEASMKPCRIMGKTMISKGIVQLNMMDGRNINVKKDDYGVGDTLVVSLPEQGIKEHYRLENGMTAYLIGGKRMGDVGTIQAIEGDNVRIKSDKGTYDTSKRYAFVIGKDKPSIKTPEKK